MSSSHLRSVSAVNTMRLFCVYVFLRFVGILVLRLLLRVELLLLVLWKRGFTDLSHTTVYT